MESDASKTPSNKSCEISVKPSSSSKNTVVKGPKYTRWDSNEVNRSSEPYRNRLFEVTYKPPPNEFHHLGGLGFHKPRLRSKVHPLRPTVNQQLGRQRTGNRINFSITLDPSAAKKSIPKRKNIIEPTKNYVDRVVFADNLNSPKSPQSLTPTVSSASAKASHHYSQPLRNSGSKETDDAIVNYLDTKRRASAQWLLHGFKQFSLETDSPRENDIIDFLDAIRNGQARGGDPRMCVEEPKRKIVQPDRGLTKGGKLLAISKTKSICGALYGPNDANKRQKPTSKMSEKFQLPIAMADRLAKKTHGKTVQTQGNRKSMREHIMKPFPTSDSSEDGECQDNFETVKSLTLVKSGYFAIPKIKVLKRKRKDRLKTNRFLNKHQLNRIRYLFFDERQKWAQSDELDLAKEPPPQLLSRSRDYIPISRENIPRSEQSFDQGNAKIYSKLKSFLSGSRKNRQKEDLKANKINFQSYLKGNLDVKLKEPDETVRSSSVIKNVSFFAGHEKGLKTQGRLKAMCNAHPPKLFKQSRTKQSYCGLDERDSEYLDPNFMVKQRYPETKAMKGSAYTLQSAMRYHTNVRARLQVSNLEYDEERFGFGEHAYLHCLATEWDENFVNELEGTKKFKRFRVKTDVIRMREAMRKNFNMYYILENLANLRNKQRHEEAFIEDLDRFAEMCVDYMNTMKVNSYDSLIEKTNKLKPLEVATHQLVEREKCLRAKLGHITEALLGTEQAWDKIMKLQNYYYALMNTEWRKENDWIHRGDSGELEIAIYSIERCRTANIRCKNDPSGFAVIEYFEAHIFPNIERIRKVKPELELLKKGLNSMQSEVFTYLNQYNKTLAVFEKIMHTFQKQMQTITERMNGKERQIYFHTMRQEFIEERNHVLQYEANQITQKPLEEAIKNLHMRRVTAVCEELYKNVMPLNLRSTEVDKRLDSIEKFSRLHQYIMEVLHTLDKLPVAVLKFTESRMRQQRQKLMDEGRVSVIKQARFELLQKQLRGFFRFLQPNRIKSKHSKVT